MAKVSVIIPACNEVFLQNTIDSVFQNAHGDIEVIVHLDGYWPSTPIKDEPRLTLIHNPIRVGMRQGINNAAKVARGDYLCKLDGHCLVAPGFDTTLAQSCDKDWIVVPRRYSLDAEKWAIENNGKVRDAHYLSYPTAFDGYLGFGMHVKDWPERGKSQGDLPISDEMISQGSCWFMHKEYFVPLQDEGYGTFIQESQELMLRCWLTGGQVKCNKQTWYAHLWKGKKYGRMYDLSREESKKGEIYSADFWFNNKSNLDGKRVHDLDWLIDKFWPVPTWPENYRDLAINWPEKETATTVSFVPKIETLCVSSTYDGVIAYILNKFNVNTHVLPVVINYNRSEWGKLFNELGYKKGAEVGVYAGEYSETLCRDNPGVEHYAIDPWLAYPEYVNHRRQQGLCSAEEEARKRLAPFGANVIKKFSMEAVKEFADNSLDYVYIDGNHDFQNVTNDIVEWEKKVRPGGIVAGHDFDKHRFSSRCHVLQVVRAYTEAVGIFPWFIMSKECRKKDTDGNWCTSWFWVKA